MKKTIYVKGMHCPSCSFIIEGELEDIGVSARADYPKGIVTVTFDPEKHPEKTIFAAIEKAGYTPVV